MEMFQRDAFHLDCGCGCIWRWNYASTELCSFQSLYKRMGCKMRLTTCKTSYCECCSTQLIIEIKGFFLQQLSNQKELKLQNNAKEIAAVCCRTPLPLRMARWICLLLEILLVLCISTAWFVLRETCPLLSLWFDRVDSKC